MDVLLPWDLHAEGGRRAGERHARRDMLWGLIALWCYWIEVGRRDSTAESEKNVPNGGA